MGRKKAKSKTQPYKGLKDRVKRLEKKLAEIEETSVLVIVDGVPRGKKIREIK